MYLKTKQKKVGYWTGNLRLLQEISLENMLGLIKVLGCHDDED